MDKINQLNDEDVALGKEWKFNLFGVEKTLLPRKFIVNTLMRRIAIKEAQFKAMPIDTEEEIEEVEKVDKAIQKLVKDFIKESITPVTKEELENMGMDHYNIITREIAMRGQLAEGWTREQVERAGYAEREEMIKVMEEGRLKDFLETAEQMKEQLEKMESQSPQTDQ